MKKNDVLKGVVISVISLVIGFIAISVPFKLFSELSNSQMTILFSTEIAVYTILGLIFLTAKDLQSQKKAKAKQRVEKRKAQVKKLQNEWLDLAA